MRFYFMRHGESTYNVLGLCNDRIDETICLTPRGREHAERAAQALAETGIQRIISSPLPRARQTAEIVNVRHDAPIEVNPDIHDWRTGLDGRPVAELYAAIAGNPWHTRIGSGETLYEHRLRVLRFLSWLRQQPPANMLVVAHEETLRVVTAHFRGLDDGATLALRVANCEVIAFDI